MFKPERVARLLTSHDGGQLVEHALFDATHDLRDGRLANAEVRRDLGLGSALNREFERAQLAGLDPCARLVPMLTAAAAAP